MRITTALALIMIVFASCQNSEIQQKQHASSPEKEWVNSYAKLFKIFESKQYFRIEIFDQQGKIQDFKIFKDSSDYPIKNFVATSTTHLAYCQYLEKADLLLAFPNVNLISNAVLHQKAIDGKIAELGSSGVMDFEKLIALAPDIIFDYPNPSNQKQREKLLQTGIKSLLITEFYEMDALAKVEWIKLFGVLFNQSDKAQDVFERVESNYLELIEQIGQASVQNKPVKVLSGIKYGDSWHAPGGKSFTAKFFENAGAKYVWSDNQNSGSINLNFEKVFNQGLDADYWIGVGAYKSLSDLENANPKYTLFKAFKEKNIFSTYGAEKPWGANPYFEDAVMRPDLILQDIYNILNNNKQANLNYYKRLE